MSTITATPAPVINRTPLYVALGLIGVVAAAAVVVPNLTSSSVTTTTVPAPSAIPQSGGPDVAERAGVAEQFRAEARLDRLAKSQRNYAGATLAAAAIPKTVVAEQVGGLHRTYAFTGTTGYSSLRESQVPGSRPNYVYRPSADHMVWNDRFVPPFDNPTWAEAIQKHYFGTGTAG